MNTLFTGKIIHHKAVVDSTNIWADKEVKNGKVLEGTIYRADVQTQGKGQRGRIWASDQGRNLLVSFVFHPNFLKSDEQFTLIKAVSIAIKDTLDPYLIDKAKIKWPNDIYVNDTKIAGVLIESTLKGPYLGTSIIGIGINVNQQNFENALNATSVMLEIGRGVDLDRFLVELSQNMEHRYLAIKSKISVIDKVYHDSLFRLGEACDYKIGDVQIEMTNRGVDSIGQILLEDKQGRINAYGLHQVSMVI